MYKNCLNEQPPIKQKKNPTMSTSMTNGLLTNDPSLVNLNLSLLEAAFKDASPSNRSLLSSTPFASNQLIAAANAARSAQQQQSLSIRTTGDSDATIRGYHSAGANSKAILASDMSYPALLQDAARTKPALQLLQEAAKQQSCKTCDTDKSKKLSQSPFLTPKSFNKNGSHVRFPLFFRIEHSFPLFLTNRLEMMQIIMYMVMMVGSFC